MKWSKELPKIPGWYWFSEKRNEEPRMVNIVENSSKTDLLFNDGRLPRDLIDWPGFWSGPIKPPSKEPS